MYWIHIQAIWLVLWEKRAKFERDTRFGAKLELTDAEYPKLKTVEIEGEKI